MAENNKEQEQCTIQNVVVRFLKVVLFIPVCFTHLPMALIYGLRWIATGKAFPDSPLQKLMEW